jgi:hypothetical protein
MEQDVSQSELQDSVAVMKSRKCGGDVFSVADLDDQSPILCDRCGSVVGRWADVRAIANIPSKEILEKAGTSVFESIYRGVAEFSLVSIE